MTDRDYKRDSDKLSRIIADHPGIKHGALASATQGWGKPHIRECLDFLISCNRIRQTDYRPKRGPASKAYWPIDATTDPTADPLGAAILNREKAKRLRAEADSLDVAADGWLSELAARAVAMPLAA